MVPMMEMQSDHQIKNWWHAVMKTQEAKSIDDLYLQLELRIHAREDYP
jgi:hypothetical protein